MNFRTWEMHLFHRSMQQQIHEKESLKVNPRRSQALALDGYNERRSSLFGKSVSPHPASAHLSIFIGIEEEARGGALRIESIFRRGGRAGNESFFLCCQANTYVHLSILPTDLLYRSVYIIYALREVRNLNWFLTVFD